jgi:hypothetical protein
MTYETLLLRLDFLFLYHAQGQNGDLSPVATAPHDNPDGNVSLKRHYYHQQPSTPSFPARSLSCVLNPNEYHEKFLSYLCDQILAPEVTFFFVFTDFELVLPPRYF